MKSILSLKKQQRAVVWTAYSRRQGRVVAHISAKESPAATRLYKAVKARAPHIAAIFSNANSCYDVAFTKLGISQPHCMTKTETHLIESSNASIRDNLARFN